MSIFVRRIGLIWGISKLINLKNLTFFFQVKVWYQNRRTKHKREREREVETSSTLTCPLPPFSTSSSNSFPYLSFHSPSLPSSVSYSSDSPTLLSSSLSSAAVGISNEERPWAKPSPLPHSYRREKDTEQHSPVEEDKRKTYTGASSKHSDKNGLSPTSSRLEKREVPLDVGVKPSERGTYSVQESTRSFSTLFGTFHSVSPTAPSSAFKPLASRHPFYYLKKTGYPSWLP